MSPDPGSSRTADLVYGAVNEAVVRHVPGTARRLLDVGCGNGALGRFLKQQRPLHVTGWTRSEDESALARGCLDAVRVLDLDTWAGDAEGGYDCLVCSHVLEHLRDPGAVLVRLRRLLAPAGTAVIALPNALPWRQRWDFLCGRFRYTEGGTMDRTHLRFFDWQTAQQLVREAGYEMRVAESCGGFPGSRFLPGRRTLDRLATTLAPGLFGVQFVFVTQPQP